MALAGRGNDKEERILKENPSRYVLFPIHEELLWKFYKEAQASIWTAEEIDLHQDLRDWDQRLNDNERWFISHVLAFFAGSDGIVNQNLLSRFSTEIMLPEARAFYTAQAAIETVHSETYAMLLQTYIKDEKERKHYFDAIYTIPSVKKKAQWALKYAESTESFAIRLVAFILVEGLYFSGSFCAIYWLNSRSLMPGLSFSNALIARDEGLHANFGVALYKMLSCPLSQEVVYEIFDDAVAIETEFVTESLPVDLIGMNKVLMSQYIKYVADRFLYDLGYPKRYKVDNPFPWVELLSLQTKGNFFELRISDYQRSGVMNSLRENRGIDDNIFNTNAEF